MSNWIVRHPILATYLPLALFIATGGMLVAWQSHRATVAANALDNFGPVGSFAFIDKDGRAVANRNLQGKVWIAACFFTCCTESCPQLSGALARLQGELAAEPDIRLVSLTVDPTNDTPQKLSQYAETYQAIQDRWTFLTGNEADVRTFVQERLHLGVMPNLEPGTSPGNRVLHSNKLTLIDRHGDIRGYFDGTDPAKVGELKLAAQRLAREK
jgi:cytochrome oxidase Cu insertion factor (SCO1/SenC/PrrC family)